MTFSNLVIALVLFALPAFAQHSQSAKPPDDASATPAAAKSGESKSAEPKPAEPTKNPLPADKSVPQTITVNGKTLDVTTGDVQQASGSRGARSAGVISRHNHAEKQGRQAHW